MADRWIGMAPGAGGTCRWHMNGAELVEALPEGAPLPDGLAALPRLICGDDSAPTRPVPVRPLDAALTRRGGDCVIAGLHQDSPPARCHGAETAIAGFASLNPNWDGVICMPGVRTVWAHVSADEVVSFQCFLTGELLDLLRRDSSVSDRIGETWDEAGFLDAVQETMSRPERLAQRLAGLDLAARGSARAQAEGALIGAELSAARPFWLGQQVVVIGAGDPARAYLAALRAQGVPATPADPDRMTLAGLVAAWRILQDT